jgi:hypothetical protein
LSKEAAAPKKPEIAFGVRRVPGGWVVTKYEIQDNKVTKKHQSDPEWRAFALDRFLTDTNVFWEAE